VYCPACGVKNDGSPLKCFICGYIIPTGQASADLALAAAPSTSNGRSRSRSNGNTVAATESFAAIGDRMLALILDRVVVVALLAIPTALIIEHGSGFGTRFTSTPLRAATAAGVVILVTILVYHIVLEALFGATIGKGLLGLHVRNGSGEKWLASAIRNVARILDSIALYSLAFLFAAFSSKRQRIGDRLAGTVVVEQPVAWGARVALIFIWLAVVGGSLWIANFLCPSCVPASMRLPR